MTEDSNVPAGEIPGNPPDAQYRRFEGMREYEALIDELIGRTQRVIRVFDRQLSPAWNTPHRQEALRQFMLTNRQNRLFIAVHDARTRADTALPLA